MARHFFKTRRWVTDGLSWIALGLILVTGCQSDSKPVSKQQPSSAEQDATQPEPARQTSSHQPAQDEASEPTESVVPASNAVATPLALENGDSPQAVEVAATENANPPAPSGKAEQADASAESKPDSKLEQADSNSKSAVTYTDTQLHKNLTTLVLAYQPDVRARHLIKFVRNQLTPEQEDAALKLLLQNDFHFRRLARRREETLNAAVDGDDTSQKLRQIRIDTIEISNQLRTLVYQEILTPQQKEQRQKAIKESRFAKKPEIEKR